jgi:hypothetical protein
MPNSFLQNNNPSALRVCEDSEVKRVESLHSFHLMDEDKENSDNSSNKDGDQSLLLEELLNKDY